MVSNHKRSLSSLSTDHLFEHRCHCGKWGTFGYGFNSREQKLGTWYCGEHVPKPAEAKPWEPEEVVVEPEPQVEIPPESQLSLF